jgi:hypothetical protein
MWFMWNNVIKYTICTCLHTRNMNEEPFENTFGAILNCFGCNINPTEGWFVDALKTSIISDLRMMVLFFWIIYNHWWGHLILQSSPTSHDKETPDDASESFHVGHQVLDIGAAVHAGDKELLSIAYISDSNAGHLNCCYPPVSSYISRSSMLQNNFSTNMKSWLRLLAWL